MKLFINSIGAQKSSLNEYKYPSWWTGTQIPVTYDDNGIYHDYNIEDNVLDLMSSTPYYVALDGDNSNGGLSASDPLRTVSYAQSTLGAKLVYVSAGVYPNGRLTQGSDSEDIAIVGVGDVVATYQSTIAFVPYNSIFQMTIGYYQSVLDMSVTDSDGFWGISQLASSVADCEANSNTHFYEGGVLYVNPNNDISDILVNNNSIYSYNASVNERRLYLKNITYATSIYFTVPDNTVKANVYMNNIRVPYPAKTDGNSGHNNIYTEGAFLILQNCFSRYANRDNLNYHNATGLPNYEAIEIDCVSKTPSYYDNGSTSNQASTAHEGMNMLRIGGTYRNGNAHVIADVNEGAHSVVIGAEVNQAKEILPSNNVIATMETSEFFMSKLLGASGTLELRAASPSVMTLRNCESEATEYVGNIEIID